MISNSKSIAPELPAPFHFSVKAGDILSQEGRGAIELDARQREELAKLLGVQALNTYRFEYDLRRMSVSRYSLSARLSAEIVQTCVVTLDPVETKIDEKISVEFWPGEEIEKADRQVSQEAGTLVLDDLEPLDSDNIPVGRLAYECLADALDPYPRKVGVTFEGWGKALKKSDQTKSRPFDILEKLLPNGDESTG